MTPELLGIRIEYGINCVVGIQSRTRTGTDASRRRTRNSVVRERDRYPGAKWAAWGSVELAPDTSSSAPPPQALSLSPSTLPELQFYTCGYKNTASISKGINSFIHHVGQLTLCIHAKNISVANGMQFY